MPTIKADLHMHGPIGFQPYWLKVQGYAGKNLLQLIADTAIEKNITICAVTSESLEIPRGSVHDRLGILRDIESKLLPKDYTAETLGGNNNVLVIEKEGAFVYLVNGQTVGVFEDGKKYDHLVVGSNQIPNGMNFQDTLNFGIENSLIQIAEHPYVEAHFGIGKEKLEKLAEKFDAIEGHNSQMCLPSFLSRLPIVGQYTSKSNIEAKQASKKLSKPYIATSDAHRIEDLGISYIEWQDQINTSSEEAFLTQLKNRIRAGNFTTEENYENFFCWLSWIAKFQKGIKSQERISQEDKYIPSNQF